MSGLPRNKPTAARPVAEEVNNLAAEGTLGLIDLPPFKDSRNRVYAHGQGVQNE